MKYKVPDLKVKKDKRTPKAIQPAMRLGRAKGVKIHRKEK